MQEESGPEDRGQTQVRGSESWRPQGWSLPRRRGGFWAGWTESHPRQHRAGEAQSWVAAPGARQGEGGAEAMGTQMGGKGTPKMLQARARALRAALARRNTRCSRAACAAARITRLRFSGGGSTIMATIGYGDDDDGDDHDDDE